MKLLVTGARGMLGRTLTGMLRGHDIVGVDLDECDLTRAADVRGLLAEQRPDAVVHCAAMTAVDLCEQEPDRAWAANALASGNVASACHAAGARLVAISTDYVFCGQLDRPYHEWDATAPQTVYGQSKLAGEEMIRAHCPQHVIARTAWLYGPGGPSFVHTMRRIGSLEGEPVRVVNDQVGSPTSTLALGRAIGQLLEAPVVGTFHLSCGGQASWYEFAAEIFRRWGLGRGLEPCTTLEYPRPARRPANSRLEGRALRLHGLDPLPHWVEALEEFAREHPDG